MWRIEVLQGVSNRNIKEGPKNTCQTDKESLGMAKYAVCEKCGKLYEYIPQTKYEGGTSYSTVTCPHCGNVKTTSRNHVHYGNDRLG